MSGRYFRLGLGVLLLGLLYSDAILGVKLLIGYLIFEGLTNLKIPLLALRIFPVPGETTAANDPAADKLKTRFSIEAERVWRLCVASMLFMSVVFHPESLWWAAWFIGFTVLGAGVSGVCPVLNGLRLAGFR